MNEKTVERIRRRRYEAALKEERRKMAEDPDYIQNILDPEDFAGGGIAGLRERTGYQRGGPPGGGDPGMTYTAPSFLKRREYPPSLRHPELREEAREKREEAEFEAMWRGAPPGMEEREKMFRKARTARLLEEERIKNFEKKIRERKKRFPYADMTEAEFAKLYPKIYAFMKKDPAWDWETFQKVSFANPGETYQATGASDIGLPLGRTDTKNLDLFMTPFGEDTYETSSEGPFNKKKIMSDQDKAQVALHEMRHKKILTEPRLTEAQPPLAVEMSKLKQAMPGMVRDYPGAHQKMPLMYRHANPPDSKEEFSHPLDMHEVFTRFMDRQYGSLKTPSGPYFDKIWRDEWQPYADKYEKILTEYDLSPVNLAVGGRASTGLNYLLGEDDQNARVPVAEGGRMGFKDGTKFDPKRRTVLKGIAALSTIPIIGKFFNWAKPLAKTAKVADLTSVPIGNPPGMPDWFKPLVNKVIKEGEDMTKQFATKEREIVHSAKIGDDEMVHVYQDLDNGSVKVQYNTANSMGEYGVDLNYKASEWIEPKVAKKGQIAEPGMKTSDEFSAVEAEPRVMNWDGDIEWDGENVVSAVDDLMTDTTKLETYATGKKPNIKKLLKSEQKQKKTQQLNESNVEQAEYIEQKYGPGPDPDDLLEEASETVIKKESGGRVPFIFGGSTGLKGLWKKLMGPKSKTLFPKIKKDRQELGRLIDPKTMDSIESLNLQQLENMLEALKIDKRSLKHIAETKAMEDPGLDFLMGKMKEDKSFGLDFDQLAKYTDIDNDIMIVEQMIKNKTMKGRKPNATGGRVPFSGGAIVKGGNWFLKTLRGTREAIKKNKDYSPGQIKLFLRQIDDQIKNIEAGGAIPDEVIQTIRSDPKFKSVGQWQTSKKCRS